MGADLRVVLNVSLREVAEGTTKTVEVARRMDSSRGALYKLLHDARKRLRAYFDERGITLDENGACGADRSPVNHIQTAQPSARPPAVR